MDNNPRWARFVAKNAENNSKKKLRKIPNVYSSHDLQDLNNYDLGPEPTLFKPISSISSNFLSNSRTPSPYTGRLSPSSSTFNHMQKHKNNIEQNTKNAAETIQKIVRKYLEEKHKKNKEKNCTDCFVMGGKRKTRRVKKSNKSKKTKKSKKSKKSRKSRK